MIPVLILKGIFNIALNLRRVFQAVYFLKGFKTKHIDVFLDHVIPASLPD
jgi:hypothetical protein